MSKNEKLVDKLKSEFEAIGFSTAQALRSGTGVNWHAWRSLDGAPHCASNHKPPTICVTPWDLGQDGETSFAAVEFDLSASLADEKWVQIKVYGVTLEEAAAYATRAEAVLRTAWGAIHKWASPSSSPTDQPTLSPGRPLSREGL